MRKLRNTALLLLAAVVVSCRNEVCKNFDIEIYTPEYASGFAVAGAEGWDSRILITRNPWQGAEGVETRLFISYNGELPPEGFSGEVLLQTPSRIVCVSSTHIAMLDAVGAADRIVGVSGIDYVTNDRVRANRDRIGDIGYEGNIDYEMLVSLEPDVVLLFGINGASSMEGKLHELGIPFAYIGDYLEESPLGKAEWVVAIGEIVGRGEAARRIFGGIPERYDAMKRLASEAAEAHMPTVMVNTPYGDSWFMAPASSYVARLISDAGGRYVYDGNTTTRSLPVDMEEASLLVSESDVWLNVGYLKSLDELKRALPKFADARCVIAGDVWNCDRRMMPSGGNDYWESGVMHPDLILRDMIKIFHPELFADADFVYYRQLK